MYMKAHGIVYLISLPTILCFNTDANSYDVFQLCSYLIAPGKRSVVCVTNEGSAKHIRYLLSHILHIFIDH